VTGIFLYFVKILFDFLAKSVFSIQILNLHVFQGWLFPPGTFTVFPWLFVFFLGVYAYQVSARTNLYLSLLSMLIFLVIFVYYQDPAQIDLVNKWNMSLSYFLFSCFCLFFSFSLVKMFPLVRANFVSRFLFFLGRNSLLFLYVHILIINILYRLGISKLVWLYWPLILTLSGLLIYFLLMIYPKINAFKLFETKFSWGILTACVILTPLIFKNLTTIFLLEFLWGICLSLNYLLLKSIFRVKSSSPTDNERIALIVSENR
jgi:hypothetical protein